MYNGAHMANGLCLVIFVCFILGVYASHSSGRTVERGRSGLDVQWSQIEPEKMVFHELSGHYTMSKPLVSRVHNRTRAHVMRCSDVGLLSTPENPNGACEAVVTKCNPANGMMNYLALPYCAMPERKWLAFFILLAWVLILCIWIFSIVDFLCPNLIAMTDVCEMRESVAGVTFLAFGHGAPEVFDMVASALLDSNGMALAIGQVLGQGMFVFCFVQGIVALMFPFVVKGSEFVRDVVFYAVGIILAVLVLSDGNLTLFESILMISMYGIYMSVVVWFDSFLLLFGLPPVEEASAIEDRVNEQKKLLSTERYKGYSYIFESRYDTDPVELRDYLNPIDPVKFVEGTAGEKFFQVAILPLFLVMFVYTHTLPDYFTEDAAIAGVFWGAVLLGVGLALVVLGTSQAAYPPDYQMLFAFTGFGVCLVWIFATAQEIVNIMVTLGQVGQVGRAIIGMTLLAVGVASQELVCNIGLASAGHAGIAVAACVGSPLFIIYLGVGFAGFAGNLFVSSPYPMVPSTQFTGGVVFLLLAVISSAVWLLLTRPEGPVFDLTAGRGYGLFLVGLYTAFITLTILFELSSPTS